MSAFALGSAGSTRAIRSFALYLGLLFALGAAGSAHGQPTWRENPERSSSGEVEITLTPRDVSAGRFRIDIVVTTHSGSLQDLDLKSATELLVAGSALKPLKVPAMRGHHVRGALEFALDQLPNEFEVVIRGVRGAGEVRFRWP